MKGDDVEMCANCGRTIGRLETPYVWNDNVVCGTCNAALCQPQATALADDGDDVKYVDEIPPLGNPPKPPFFQFSGRITYVPMKKVRLLLRDPDTREDSTAVIDIPNDTGVRKIHDGAATELGKCLKKITVLERFWQEEKKFSGLEKVLMGVAVVSLFSGMTRDE